MEWNPAVITVLVGLGGLGAVIASFFGMRAQATKYVEEKLEKRLDQISGGRLKGLEDLVAEASREERLREETPIAVYGQEAEALRAELARGRFLEARLAENLVVQAGLAVVEVRDDEVDEDLVRERRESYVLVYKEGLPYRGALPAGSFVTFANSRITLEARLLEALRHGEVRRRAP